MFVIARDQVIDIRAVLLYISANNLNRLQMIELPFNKKQKIK